jgi:predicted permease
MAALIACGLAWRWAQPQGLDADTVRRAITSLVFVLLLPALVLDVLWQTSLGADSLRISMAAAGGVLSAIAMAWLFYRLQHTPKPMMGALILASAFPNVTYMGLPVLEQTLGPWARSIAIQYDLFATTPLLLTIGILIARHHGPAPSRNNIWLSLLQVPPLWAALIAVIMNLAHVPLPAGLGSLLKMMGSAVVPLMLVSMGLALSWNRQQFQHLPSMIPALLIQMVLMPLLVWGLASTLGLHDEMLTGVVLEAAMPCMVIGIVLCDRYGLDTSLYATLVTLSTLLSLISLPLWFEALSGT